jgi:4-amino-4-deoxy-L-arabinose transferase-like glycosyltransferase
VTGSDEVDDPERAPPGNPLRLRALLPLTLGCMLALVAMAGPSPSRAAFTVGAIGIAIAIAGALDLLGTFDDDDHLITHRVSSKRLAPSFALAFGAALGAVVVVRLAVAGWLSSIASSMLVPSAGLLVVIAGERMLVELGWLDRRPIWRRYGFWLAVIATLLYLPMLGNHSLIDPWETHYAEVSREMLARQDWISPWWAHEKWFWSKPILLFWLQAAAMVVFGVRYEPGRMLSAIADGREPHPEWALRLPVFALVLAGGWLLYRGVSSTCGQRAGFLGAVVLFTMPQFFLMAHQTTTDMPYVACMAGSVGACLWAASTDRNEIACGTEIAIGRHQLRVSPRQALWVAVLVVVLPQILYLASRNLAIVVSPQFDLRAIADRFAWGSAGNCGNIAVDAGGQVVDFCPKTVAPAFGLAPGIQATLWLACTALWAWIEWGERRKQRLLYLCAWWLAGLATMAKGPAGVGLPVIAALAWLAASRRWSELRRMEIPAGLMLLVIMVVPWFVAMYVRHGAGFTERLLFGDMFKRAFRHMHDTNEGVDVSFRYYLWQLGYATFPWVGLVPLAMARATSTSPERRSTALALAGWALFAYVFFTWMGTKFHHYILPALPPLAMLLGLTLDELLRPDESRGAMVGAAALAGTILTWLVGRDLFATSGGDVGAVRLMQLFTYLYTRAWPSSLEMSGTLWWFALLGALTIAALVIERLRKLATTALVMLAAVWAAWGLDAYLAKASPHWGQRELFVAYERARMEAPGPLVAYQMNWKGENFYRGNQLAIFVTSGRKLHQWLDRQKVASKTFYFVTEHRRVNGLLRELGGPDRVDRLTDERLNNKFQLLRVTFP